METSRINSNKLLAEHSPFKRLIKLIDALRGSNGCPWDRQQTPGTLTVFLIEEVYELVDAIESGNPDEVREELGDVLFHIFFVAAMFQETGRFNINDVAESIIEKMIRRHPHVFGQKKINDTDQVKEQWHAIKQQEKSDRGDSKPFSRIVENLPALMRAYRVSERASRIGLDWQDISGVLEKAEEEWTEFKSAMGSDDPKQKLMEFGDILFTLVNVARFAGVHPESALTAAIRKFERRLKLMEKTVSDQGLKWEALSQAEIDRLWENIKEIKEE